LDAAKARVESGKFIRHEDLEKESSQWWEKEKSLRTKMPASLYLNCINIFVLIHWLML
jgi:hypothetical protein